MFFAFTDKLTDKVGWRVLGDGGHAVFSLNSSNKPGESVVH